MNEQELCKKRLIDLSKQANRKGIVLFSDFLNLNELNIYHRSERLFETKTESFGGVPYAERQIIAFIPDALYLRDSNEENARIAGAFDDCREQEKHDLRVSHCCYEWNYPIAALRIVPAYPKFAEKLGHRDILGAIMKLGVDRSKIGDIIIDDGVYYLLCEENIADYFRKNLDKIRHTIVKIEECAPDKLTITHEMEEKDGIITSNRLDSVIACVHKLSRSQALELFRQEKVFVNGKMTTNATYSCHTDDIISVRGYGRFIYLSEHGETNKGRLKFKYNLYKN